MNIGILGGGQLAQMLALAGIPLGMRFTVLDPAEQAPAGAAAHVLRAPFDDAAALDQLAACSDVISLDFENVPVATVTRLAAQRPVRPGALALATSQDRLAEKTLCHRLGLPTAPFATADSAAELASAARTLGTPALAKTRRFGYDGKGQYRLAHPDEAAAAWEALGGQPLILEGWVPFDFEVSLLAVRRVNGDQRFYPLSENRHHDGILRCSRAPFDDPALQREAQRHAGALLEALDYVGVLAIEFFVQAGRLLVNELAPRVHNSGHWTIEGAQTSQFENHLRAICDLPLGSTDPRGHAAMVNLIGREPPLAQLAAMPELHLHRYGKSARPGRKLGHVTVTAASAAERERRLAPLATLCEVEGPATSPLTLTDEDAGR